MKIRKILAVAALVAMFAAPASVKAASDTASASATIAAAVTVTKVSDLEFGLISPTGTAGTVTISDAGARTGDANVVLQSGTTPSQASFNVSGSASQAITVTIPSTAVLTGSGTDMTATLSQTEAGSQTLDGSGAFTVDVGATLAVGANQGAGAYSGSFDVTVVYN
ncbi:DUF4402 domain-containing protein [Thalassospiraceae bacterium LMO-JJ14]|nr:DUF4402 domain-containing protein [Thalassospiraceae bacterium LMO-JJ14]